MNPYISLDLGYYWDIGWRDWENLKRLRIYMLWNFHRMIIPKYNKDYNWKNIDMKQGEIFQNIMIPYAHIVGDRLVAEVLNVWDFYPEVEKYCETIEDWITNCVEENRLFKLARPESQILDLLGFGKNDICIIYSNNIKEWKRNRNWWSFTEDIIKVLYVTESDKEKLKYLNQDEWENINFI